MQEHELEQARNIIAKTLRDKIVPKLKEYKFSVEVRDRIHILGEVFTNYKQVNWWFTLNPSPPSLKSKLLLIYFVTWINIFLFPTPSTSHLKVTQISKWSFLFILLSKHIILIKGNGKWINKIIYKKKNHLPLKVTFSQRSKTNRRWTDGPSTRLLELLWAAKNIYTNF